MKKLNKKGFTLIELLAVIVLLAIVGVVGANIIIKRLNKAKRDTFMNTYNDVKKELSNQVILGEPTCIPEGKSDGKDCIKKFDLNKNDFDLDISLDDKGYKITLTGKGTYSNMDLTQDSGCGTQTNATCGAKSITGIMEQ